MVVLISLSLQVGQVILEDVLVRNSDILDFEVLLNEANVLRNVVFSLGLLSDLFEDLEYRSLLLLLGFLQGV